MSTATTYQYLEPHPGSSYKQLFIKGTKLLAFDIYCAAYQRGDEEDRTPEQVAGDFSISLEAVYEAIRYGESKPIEVDYDVRRQDLMMEANNMFHPEYKFRPRELYRPLMAEDRARIKRQLQRGVWYPVNLYIDDDSVDGVLVQMLRAAGHDVVIPNDINQDGAADAADMLEAIQRSRVMLTKNYGDFEALHDLVMFLGGHHSGIFVVRKDNDPKRIMDRRRIARAIRNFASSGLKVEDGVHVLNFYR